MVDLSVHLDWARPDGDAVVVGGGATMGTVLDALAGEGRTVPIGIVRLDALGALVSVGFLTFAAFVFWLCTTQVWHLP